MTSARERRIAAEAARWVVRLDGPFTARDVRAFRAWIGRSEDHRAIFERTSRAWNQLDLLAKLDNFPLPAHEPVRVDRRALIIGGAAGALALGVGGYAVLAAGGAEAYETGIGEVRDVVLGDGTRVALDADTRIEVRIKGHRREAHLVRGEALFEVAEKDALAFSVLTDAGGVEIAHGTVLAKILPVGARISVLSGEASAWASGAAATSPRVELASRGEIALGAGSEVQHAEPAQLDRRTLWREGRLAFDNAPLSEAVADVARQTGARFVFADPALADLRVGGVVDAHDLEGFLVMLHENLGIVARRRGDGAIELSAARPRAH